MDDRPRHRLGPDPFWPGRPATFVLGAGFSKAISSWMPLARELTSLYPSSKGRDIERWLSYLASPQPFLTRLQNMWNAAAFAEASLTLASYIDECQANSYKEEAPQWLVDFGAILSSTGSRAITFNYDALLDRGAALGGFDSRPDNVIRLHGSTLESWDPDHPSEVRTKQAGSWDSFPDPDWLLMDRMEPFLVPPVVVKSRFYDVAALRDRWLMAANLLREPGNTALLGYSLPEADHVSAFMIGDALSSAPGRKCIAVADLDSRGVMDRLHSLGLRVDFSTSGPDSIPELIQSLEPWAAIRSIELIEPPSGVGESDLVDLRVCLGDSSAGGCTAEIERADQMLADQIHYLLDCVARESGRINGRLISSARWIHRSSRESRGWQLEVSLAPTAHDRERSSLT